MLVEPVAGSPWNGWPDVHGIRGRITVVHAPRSNGQTEGQINRLKTLKRQMYGRANIDLLKARLVAAE